MRAKVKADDLKRIRESVERQKQKEEQIVQEPLHFEQSIPNEPENKVVEKNTNWAEFRVEGTREQLLELTNVLVNLRNNTSFEFKVTNKGEL